MKRRPTLAATLALALTSTLFVAGPTAASNEIAEREALACTSCHDKPGSKLLTDRGKYFELMGALDGYEQLSARFTRCTSCHVRKPGSPKLTDTGRRYQWMMGDMEGLREWLMSRHPARPSAHNEKLEDGPSPSSPPEPEDR